MTAFKMFAAVLTIACSLSQVAAKTVHAHVVAGNSGSYTYDNWVDNINLAKSASIDGFIMNITPDTYQLDEQLTNVYQAASALGDFTIFLSFDYLGGGTAWEASDVIDILNNYTSQSAQFRYNDLPVVTTFEGVDNTGDWPNIKSATGGLFFIPDYSSLGATDAAEQPAVDGLASWVAWPNGPNYMTNASDVWYVDTLGSKPYMMPVSPWFYADVNSENYLYRGDRLWYDRWQEVIQTQPDLVQIVTWNDFGESHYVGPLPPADANAIPGSPPETYTANYPHQGWLSDLPYFISMYKTGEPPSGGNEHITIAYKLNPSSYGSDGGTVCESTDLSATYPPADCSLDEISITVLADSESTVTAAIEGQGTQTWTAQAGMNFFALPFNGLSGTPTVSLTRGGSVVAQVSGSPIADGDVINWNAWVASSLTT